MKGFKDKLMNRWILSGHLGADPEVKTIKTAKGDMQITSFRIGHTNVSSKKGEDGKFPTNWIECTMFGKQGEFIAANAKKGSKVVVDGRYIEDTFVGKDGAPKTKAKMTVDSAELLNQATGGSTSAAPSNNTVDEESIPF